MTIIEVLIGTVIVILAIRWCWKQVWKFWHKSLGLADIKQISHWGPEEFDRHYKYACRRFDLATSEKQKKERSEEILALMDVARHHGFVLRREGESFDTLHFVPGGIENEADKPILTEQEAAAVLVGSSLRNTQHAWPTVYNSLKEVREEKFAVADESSAAFDLGLAAIALDLQAVKNLFPVEQAGRIENWVLTWVWNFAATNGRGGYALDEVKKYGVAFQKESRIGAEFALGAIPGRLLHRWLGGTIKNFEFEIGGKKSGFINTMLMSETTSVLIGFSGFWKAFADKYKLVDGAPKYTLTTTKILENLDKTDQIMTNHNLSEAQRAEAISELSED
jgi:hypothetical protein